MTASRTRVWTRRAGLALVLAGLVLLGYVGWQLVGTNWVAERRQTAGLEGLREAWDAGADDARVEAGTAHAVVRIPRFGDDWEMPVLAGTDDDVLAAGVGHFEGTAGPGERGNHVLAGHRITHGEPFRDLPELQPGDTVVVETRTDRYTYALDTAGDALSVPFTDTWVLDTVPTHPDDGVQPDQRAGQRLLTLVTCAELFHTDERLVVFGHLVDRERRTG